MTPDMIMVLAILLASVVLLVTEWVPMEVTALLVLGTTAVTGLVPYAESLAGFSNPAVVTVWAVFILSGGLTRTGVADIIGRFVLAVAGTGEARMIIVIMSCAALMSAMMNNVAVAALMMPVVMDIARRTGCPAPRLLMPLAYGSLLGGLTTLIGTPPNILVSQILKDSGHVPFGLFDFTPVGGVIMVAGILFMAFAGRFLLPRSQEGKPGAPDMIRQVEQGYHIRERLFMLRVPPGSKLSGQSLSQLSLGRLAGLNVVGITRSDRTLISPLPETVLAYRDILVVEGILAEMENLKSEMAHWSAMDIVPAGGEIQALMTDDAPLMEMELDPGCPFIGKSLSTLLFRNRYDCHVLAILREKRAIYDDLHKQPLLAGDTLLLQSRSNGMRQLKEIPGIRFGTAFPDRERLTRTYHLDRRLLCMTIPEDSHLTGKTLGQSNLGATLRVEVLAMDRGRGMEPIPSPDIRLEAGQVLVISGRLADLELLRALVELELLSDETIHPSFLENRETGFIEAMLSPHSTLAGQTLSQLNFRSKYGLNVLAVFRGGRAHRTHLRNLPLQLGDALLMLGPRSRFSVLAAEPDFVLLTREGQTPPNLEKAGVSVLVMALVLLPVMMGWIPIYIAAVMGAAVMIMTRCLTMEEAYRAIEWKGIFLIAGMMPLGSALDSTGTARYLAEAVVSGLGGLGPYVVIFALMGLTFLATCVIPTAALVVLMAPIALSTATDMGISAHAVMMAIAVAASASFMTPISHPANIMVMGPGGYRFSHYLKAGIPLTLVVWILAMVLLPIFWPLQG